MTKSPWMEEEHVLLQESARKFFEAELIPNEERWLSQGVIDRAFWNAAGNAGLLGASIPEEYGGIGGTYAHEAVITLEQSRAGNVGWGFPVHSICTHYIQAFGTDEQKQRWLPGLATGEWIPAIAMSEPGAGSDLQAITTSAIKDGNHYVINGAKTFISNGQMADLIVLVAKTDRGQGAKGVSLIVVETENAEGFRRGRNLEKLGMKSQDTSELFFDDVRVPQTNLLGLEEGQGFYQLMCQLPWERLLVALIAVGMCDEMLRITLDYVKQRKAFGQRIMDFQNTRFKLAECKTKLEVTRAFVDRCVQDILDGKLNAPTASMAKWWAAQVQCEIADECLQLHGGYGYMMEYPIARYYADARVQQIYGGTREIMKEIIAKSLDD